MRQALFLCFLAAGLASLVAVYVHFDEQAAMKAKAEEELTQFRLERETERLDFLGEYLINLKKPEEVVGYRIESDWPNWPNEPVQYRFPTSPRLLGKFPIIQGRLVANKKQIEELGSRILTSKSFSNKPPLCSRPEPSVAYEFVRKDKKLFVTMCFSCNQLTFIKDTGETFVQTFRPMRDDMVPLVKRTIGFLVH